MTQKRYPKPKTNPSPADALQESEEKFKYAFEHSVLGSSITLLTGEILVNQALCEMLGYSQSELENRKWQEITHPDDIELTQNEINSLLSGGKESTRFIKRFVHKNGSIVWTDLGSTLRRDQEGKPLYLITAVNDITERKQAEAALLESKLTAERYLNIVAEIIVLLNSEGNITHLNESGHQLLGYKTGLVGKNWFDTCVPEEDRAEISRLFEMLKNGEIQRLESHENNVITSSGERKTILWHNTILRDANNNFLGILSSGEDITNRIEMERSLRIALAKYKTLFEYFPLGVTIADGAGNILETNPAAAKLLAVSRDEHAQRSIDGIEWSIIRPNGDPMPSEEYPSVRALKKNRLIENVEMGILKPNHSTIWLNVSAIPIPLQGQGVVVTYSDITDRKRSENLLQARLRLSLFAESHTLDDLLQRMLDEAEALTDSQIGFAHFLEADQKTLELQMWSTNTVKNMCTAEGKGQHYAVDKAGVWVECIYAGAPVIHNDYASLPASRRKGLPEGHAPVIRELVVPVIRGGLTVAIVGVGNKPANYTDEDVKVALELANLTWDIIQRKRAEELLKESEWRNRIVSELTADYIFVVDVDRSGILKLRWASDNMFRMTGRTIEDAATSDLWGNIIHPDDTVHFFDFINQTISTAEAGEIECRAFYKHGGERWIHIFVRPQIGERNSVMTIVGAIDDITERKRAEKALRESEAKNRALVDAMPDLIFVHNRAGEYIDYHVAKPELLATPPHIFLGHAPRNIFPPELADPMQAKLDMAFQTGHIQTHEYILDLADGRHYFEARINAYDSDRAISIIRDITERKQVEQALKSANMELEASLVREKELAHTDMLTGVNNRRYLYVLAAHEFDIATRYHQPLSILMFDLDHFKQVNDTFGHAIGDQMLKLVTQTACTKLRSTDAIGRYGGEEFVILLPMTTAQQAFALAERIRESVAQVRVQTPIGEVAVTLSIGIVEMAQEGGQNESVDDLIRRADQAMYAAKQGGRNRTKILK